MLAWGPDTCNTSTSAGGDGAVADARKIDPFDVEALEKSLNDSATRVSTIWISFLIFSLYLLIAATTVTHRQLLLAEPVKLPVLNIDLPLWGFFFLAPILFVIFHAYVLIQLILLARTASAYDAAMAKLTEQDNLSPEANASLRQRLANTLFAQIFAGSPHEREGWFGSLLKAMAWITLVIAPILILLAFQFRFLPYHSHPATWTHRLLILAELAAVFWLWPMIFDSKRDFGWSTSWRGIKLSGLFPLHLLSRWRPRRFTLRQTHRYAVPLLCCLLFVFVSLSVATFPGEPHVNLATGYSPSSVQCSRWFTQKFDRLHLPRVDVVDDEKLSSIERAMAEQGLPSYKGKLTRDFRGRDFVCADLSNSDLRRVDLAYARVSGARLNGAALQGSSLDDAQLEGASFDFAQLQGASLVGAHLQGASLNETQLQGAILYQSELQGASLDSAQLQGASFWSANLQGTSLDGAQLQGASFYEASLQGSSLVNAKLQSTFLGDAQLQGADFRGSIMTHAVVVKALVWRARNAACFDAFLRGSNSSAIIFEMDRSKAAPRQFGREIRPTPDELNMFIDRSLANVPNGDRKAIAEKRMRDGLGVRLVGGHPVYSSEDDPVAIARLWQECEDESDGKSSVQHSLDRATFIRDLVCNAVDGRRAMVRNLVTIWIVTEYNSSKFSAHLARGLLGQDGKECAATKDLDEPTKERLRTVMAPAE